MPSSRLLLVSIAIPASQPLSLHAALPISPADRTDPTPPETSAARTTHRLQLPRDTAPADDLTMVRSEEHTSELQSRGHLVCRLLLEKKKLLYNDKEQSFTDKHVRMDNNLL